MPTPNRCSGQNQRRLEQGFLLGALCRTSGRDALYAEVGSVIRFSTTTWLIHVLEIKALEPHSRESHAANSVLLKFVCRTLSVHLSSHGAPEGSLKDAALQLKNRIIGEEHLPRPEMEPELEAVETGRGGKTGEVAWSDRSSTSECG